MPVLIITSLIWAFFSNGSRTRLRVAGPYLHKDRPDQNHWRMIVHNGSRVTQARDVQVRLVGISPRPNEPMWSADFPYPVARPGHSIDEPAPAINPRSDEVYELVIGRQSASGEFTNRWTRHEISVSKIRIESGEKWALTYRITAENAKSREFSVNI